jgi:hypothetical protein
MSWLGTEMIADSLAELASAQLQRERWLSDKSAEMSSFVEAVEQLFTDSGLEGALEKGTSGYSKEVELLLGELSKLIAHMDSNKPPIEIINDPKMAQVRAKSSEILRAFEN